MSETKEIKTALSHSTAKTMLLCEEKFVHYKVRNAPRDKDYEKSTALSLGSAVHWILEKSLGDYPADIIGDLDLCESDPDIMLPNSERYLAHAMVLKLVRLNKKCGHRFVAVEPSIDNSWFTGKIDMILEGEDGKWWIGDYKCLKSFRPDMDGRMLFRDPQLNIYASRAKDIAKLLDLDPEKFGGTRYRVCTKSSAKRQPKESEVDIVLRLVNAVKAYDIEVPVESMNPKFAETLHKKLYKRSMDLRKDPSKAVKNYNSCMNFFKPCEYWSQCHGALYSEMQLKVVVED